MGDTNKNRNVRGNESAQEDDDDFAAVDIIAAVDKYDLKTDTGGGGFKDRIANATNVKGKRN